MTATERDPTGPQTARPGAADGEHGAENGHDPVATASGVSGDTPTPLVEARGMTVRYVTRRSVLLNRPVRHLTGVHEVDLAIPRGRSYGLVGESGSGKSTTGRALLRLEEIASGSVHFDGEDITGLRGEELRRLRRRMQMVFQDPMGSLNPRESVGSILAAPLRAHGGGNSRERRRKVRDTLERVGLSAGAADRYPHEFSGGQRQRIGIARAIIQDPEFIVADEPVSALDVSVQAQILNLLDDVKREMNLTTLVIAHDLAVVRQVSDIVGVMYLGALVEEAPADDLYASPLHPYTKALLSAAPIPDPRVEDTRERIVLHGDMPSPSSVHAGCRFASRCPMRRSTRCDDEVPALRTLASGHRVACHWAEEINGLPSGAYEPRASSTARRAEDPSVRPFGQTSSPTSPASAAPSSSPSSSDPSERKP